ncbi:MULTISPECIES: hypothetical protein [unclassified Paenibacillus]|uniref:hypothetical protein n=1 Tax=unclassified Paenibacillus TaxID=185978 RepID=UPI00071034BF|nr:MULTISPECIES: hypothetical protein [unclassified Paenibacillus]KQX48226.1 hypothetical protein ASD40_08395 [Paenibacillus sp. Root444D2]KRE52191.1 hypothetical protein ASG85_03435 [Paenibacillus sp. Soil724D2]
MNPIVEQALQTTLKNWNAMSASRGDEQEAVADQFQSSFYLFIDAVREWVYELEPRPQTIDELLDMDMIQEIFDLLPAPLHLNFETELELMVDNVVRIDDDKYD